MDPKKVLALLVLGFLLVPKRQTAQDNQNQSSNQGSNQGSNQSPYTSIFNGSSSYLNTQNPRGIRNNNPGNIKISPSAWQGKVPINNNTDGVFEQFELYKWGVRAMVKLLSNYLNSGRDTIEKILDSYSGGTDSYKNYVANRTGWSRNQQLSNTKENLRKLTRALAYFENGVEAVDDITFNHAYDLI